MADDRDLRPKNETLCVMLLEDDDADAYLTRRALKMIPRVGEVIRAKNGEQAVALLQSGKVSPDIAFVDLQMPMMDGFDFLTASVDQRLTNIPMVVLTSSSAVNDALRSRVRGALRVITKPESPSELQQALQDAIDAFVLSGPAFAGWERQTWNVLPQETSRDRAAPVASANAPVTPQFGRRTRPVSS